MKAVNGPIKLSFVLDTDIPQLWKALTDHDEMVLWYFENIPEFRPDPYFEVQFPVVSGDKTFTHQWKVVNVNFHEEISYAWSYAEYSGLAIVHFKLAQNPNQKVNLKLIMEILEDFDDNIEEFKRESCIAGWQYFLGQSLPTYLKDQT